MEMKILRGGLQTTVQDLGRAGHRASGVPLSGAMDPFALRVGNLLVGNSEGAAALEFTLIGPEVEFSEDALVAVCGAECAGIANWRPVEIGAGKRLKLGPCVQGCRGYLAVRGGIDVEPVMGSRSTYLRGGWGGFAGRALRDGDRLPVGRNGAAQMAGAFSKQGWKIDPRMLPTYGTEARVRVIRGARSSEWGDALYNQVFRVSAQSDRMGLWLAGTGLQRASGARESISAAVVPGTVQVPPDGQPVVLMADAQTIGGYPQIAHVICVDRPVMAQLRPHDTLRFAEVSLDEAHRLAVARDRSLALLREGLAEKANGMSPSSTP